MHNTHVVRDLEDRGAIFVESEGEVPEGEPGHLLRTRRRPIGARRRGPSQPADDRRDVPLVTKVHSEARQYASLGYSILLIGHAGHDEIEGTLGEAPDAILLVQSVDDAELVDPANPSRVAYLTQTTLSVDETADIVRVLRRRFPQIVAPRKDDICYATSNRQWAVKALLPEVDLVLVIGSSNSSNSQRLVDVAHARAASGHT